MGNKIIIIGGGPGGYTAAIRASQLGGEVTLIESHKLGGTCLHYGCIPSKMLRKSADMLESLKKAKDWGISTQGQLQFDIDIQVQHKNKVVASQEKGIAQLMSKNNVCYLQGNAKVCAENTIEVLCTEGETKWLKWDKLILATGSEPLSIPAFPFDHQNILSSSDMLSLDKIPKSLIIVGGGVIGCEFASIFANLGSKVTIIEALNRLLPVPGIDPEISKNLQRELKKKKVSIITKKTVEKATIVEDGIEVSIRDSDKLLMADKMVVCVGRTAISKPLELDSIGVKTDDRGWIEVDSQMQTNITGIYAIGDCIGPAKIMLAHVAATEGEIAAANCLGDQQTMSYDVIPSAIFTSPEIGCVGLTEEEAIENGYQTQADSVLYRTLGKAHASGEIAGTVKIISEQISGKILGVHLIGARATDILGEATLALSKECTLTDLAHTIHAHPTFAEILLEVTQKALGQPIHG